MKKFFNVEMKQTDPDADALRAFCKRNGIYYEASDCGNGCVHFEIKCDRETADRIEKEVFT